MIKQNQIETQYTSQKEILSFREATAYLDVSKSLLYKLTSNHKIKFYKPNKGRIFFKRKDLDNWMLQNEQPPITDFIKNQNKK